jgi:hypothetical protein
MKGKDTFSASEVQIIKHLIRLKLAATRNEQKKNQEQDS